MTPSDVERARFSAARLGDSYDMRQVDDFLESLSRALSGEQPLLDGQLESARFRRTWLREGYRAGEVERFLDWAKATLRASGGAAYVPPPRFRLHVSPIFVAQVVVLAVLAGGTTFLFLR
jgi:DivIVA domain-containing protein